MNQETIKQVCEYFTNKHLKSFTEAFKNDLFGFESDYINLQQTILLNRIQRDILEQINRSDAIGEERAYYLSVLDKCILDCKKESDLFVSKLDRI
ncbi:hypothetical protein AXE80_10785 [Wenyingzhuangia fucanilytica]|uniref:Uncharacterized protein n=1 Tax=Wenyingzhuangia fucanilytica TaxID=1790137 RepID=A0A1B1Y7L6_9FLAO|nr:hypothetical protein AXE80_10785 [Wenyingzhuangia fucanilytica]